MLNLPFSWNVDDVQKAKHIFMDAVLHDNDLSQDSLGIDLSQQERIRQEQKELIH